MRCAIYKSSSSLRQHGTFLLLWVVFSACGPKKRPTWSKICIFIFALYGKRRCKLSADRRKALHAPAPDQPEQHQPDQKPNYLQPKVARDNIWRQLAQNQLDRKVDPQLKGQILRDLLDQ